MLAAKGPWFDRDSNAARPKSRRQNGDQGLMGAYILRRLLLMIPTIFGIMAISFVVVQFAPGGPVEQMIAKISGTAVMAGVSANPGGDFAGQAGAGAGPGKNTSQYRGAQGLRP